MYVGIDRYLDGFAASTLPADQVNDGLTPLVPDELGGFRSYFELCGHVVHYFWGCPVPRRVGVEILAGDCAAERGAKLLGAVHPICRSRPEPLLWLCIFAVYDSDGLPWYLLCQPGLQPPYPPACEHDRRKRGSQCSRSSRRTGRHADDYILPHVPDPSAHSRGWPSRGASGWKYRRGMLPRRAGRNSSSGCGGQPRAGRRLFCRTVR